MYEQKRTIEPSTQFKRTFLIATRFGKEFEERSPFLDIPIEIFNVK